jgi:hypothetical protein
MSKASFVEAVSHDDDVWMKALLPKLKKFLMLEADSVSVDAAIQHRELPGKLPV